MSIYNSLKNRIELILTETPAPTPLADGGVITHNDMGVDLCTSGITSSMYGIASNFLEADFTPWAQYYNGGTTNIYNVTEGATFGVKRFLNSNPFTKFQLQAAACNDISWIDQTTKSALLAWDALIEATAIYGIPTHNVAGLLWGSGIPQFADPINYFDGSATGEQMVNSLLEWADIVYSGSEYRFKTDILAIPPSLVKVLNKTNYNQYEKNSAMSVLKERLADSATPIQIQAVSSFEKAKIMCLLPNDSEKLAMVHTQKLETDLTERNVDFAGVTLGCVSMQPYSSAVIRLK